MQILTTMTQTEVSLLVAALGPVVYDRDRCLSFVEWATGIPSGGTSAPEVEAVFHTYMAWNLAIQAIRVPSDPHSSDEMGRRAADHFAKDLKPLPSGANPWGLLCREIMNTEFDFILRAGHRWMIFEFKIVHAAPLLRLPSAEEWQLRRQVLAGCMMKKLRPEIERVDHFYVSNFGGPDITLDMLLPEPTGRHFAAPRSQAELAAAGDPALSAITGAFAAAPTQTIRHLSWVGIIDFLGRYPELLSLSQALRENPSLFARRGARSGR